MATIKHEKLIALLKTNYQKDATEIADCLEMVNIGLEGANESINVDMHSAMKEKDYAKIRTLTDYLEEIAGIQQLIESYAEMFDAETDSEEVETEDLLDKEQRLLPDYAEYAVDSNIAHSLYESFTFIRPAAFLFNGKKYEVNDWKEMLLKTCSLLAQRDNEMFKKLPGSPAFKGRKTTYFGTEFLEQKNAKIPGTDLYVWTNMSANAIRNIIRRLLKHFGIKITDVSVYFKADYSPLHEDGQSKPQ